jgi:nucleoid-associated protein YgaU
MKKLPILFVSSLLLASVVNTSLAADDAKSLTDALAGEAKDTQMKGNAKAAAETKDETPEPAADAAGVDVEALAEQVTSDLEALLGGGKNEVKKEDVEKVVEKAKDQGKSDSDIQEAVTTAVGNLQEKGVEISKDTFEFIQKSMKDILSSGTEDAMGDPASIYIQSLNAELAETTVKENKQPKAPANTEEKAASSSDKTEIATAQAIAAAASDAMKDIAKEGGAEGEGGEGSEGKTEASSAPQQISMDTQKGPKGTITVVRGESLSKIAARIYGDGKYYTLIFEANRDTMSDPNKIAIGQILKIPPKPAE